VTTRRPAETFHDLVIEFPIHTAIMIRRPEVGSVVHTHSPDPEAVRRLSGFDGFDGKLRAASGPRRRRR
jgi:hypothetical protein